MKNNSVWVNNKSLLLEKRECDDTTWTLVQSFEPEELGEAFELKQQAQAAQPEARFRILKLQAEELPDEIEIPVRYLLNNFAVDKKEIELGPRFYSGKFMSSR